MMMICGKSELCLFEPTAYQVVVQSAMWCDIHPTTSLDKSANIEFHIKGSTDEYLDLNDTILCLNARCSTKDGKKPIDSTKTNITTTNYLMHALFDDVIVKLNDVKIEGGSRLYAYKAIMQNELNFSNPTKQIQLRAAGYERDEAKRRKAYLFGNEFQLTGSLGIDFFQTQPKYLLPGVSVTLQLNRAKNNIPFIVTSGTDQPLIHILDAVLFVRRVRCAPAVLAGHELGLTTKNAIYPYQKSEMLTFTIAAGSQSCVKDGLFRGLMPKFIIAALVDGRANSGDYRLDAFNFQHFNLNYISLFHNGQALPYRTGYTPDFAEGKYIKDYFISIVQNMEHMNRNVNNGITESDFASGGRTFFTFNLAPDFTSNQAQQPRDGNLRLDIKFDNPLTDSINVILMGIFDTEIHITKDRNIILPPI